MTVKVLNVDPDALDHAAKGINGVIAGLGGGPTGAYTKGTGRGFSDVGLSGERVGHPGAAAALAEFTERWEWGTRALVQKANGIAVGLDMAGAGFVGQEREYLNNAAKGMANDLAGDPNLQRAQTDRMSWGDLARYNENRLTHPDYSAQSFADVKSDVEQNLRKAAANSIDASIGMSDPTHLSQAAGPVLDHVLGPRPSTGEQAIDAILGPPPAPSAPPAGH